MPIKPPLPRQDLGHPLSQGLAGHWTLHEGSGGRAADLLGNSAGTLINSPTWGGGAFGWALSLASASSQYVQLPNVSALNISGPITMACWVKTAIGNTTAGILIGGYKSSSAFDGYGFSLNISGSQTMGYWSGTKGSWQVSPSVNFNDNAWHHLAVTCTGTSVTFYMDGRQVGTATSNVPNAFAGTRNIGASTVPNNYFNGSVDDVRIYSRALSRDEVALICALTFLDLARPSVFAAAAVAAPSMDSWFVNPFERYRERVEIVAY